MSPHRKKEAKMHLWERDGSYYLSFWQNGKRIRKSFGKDKKLAECVLEKLKVKMGVKTDDNSRPASLADKMHQLINTKGSAGSSSITFRQMSGLYLENYSKTNKSSYWRDEIFLRHTNAYFGDLALEEITPLHIENYKAKRKEEVSDSTVNRELAFIRQVFNKAIAWRKTDSNPMKDVKFFKEPQGRTRYLEKDEIDKLLKACIPTLRPIVITAFNTGMRKEEILSLKWDQVDLNHNIITLCKTKNGETRHVYVNSYMHEMLENLKKKAKQEYVFTSSQGRRYAKKMRSVFCNAIKKAGLEGFRFHDLRHTFASHMAMSGAGPMQIMEGLGVKSIRMVQRYTHLSRGHTMQAVEKLSDKLNLADAS